MDCVRTSYKKPHSTAFEAMDEGLGIRENNPELYEILNTAALHNAIFMVSKETACTVSAFHMNPSDGAITFSRYSDKKGDTDHVIREILRHN